MKILHVVRQYAPSMGGIETFVQNLARRQTTLGHTVSVACLDRPFEPPRRKLVAHEWIDGIHILRLPYIGPRKYAVAPGILSAAKLYDVLHLHSSDFFLDYLAWTKLLHKKPIVLSTHGFYFHTDFATAGKRFYFKTITRMSMNGVSAILCTSKQDRGRAAAIAPVQKVYDFPNGVEVNRWMGYAPHDRETDLIISTGRLAENKRQELLLDCLKMVQSIRPAAQLILIGPDAGRRNALEKRVQQLDLEQNIHILGALPAEAMDGFLRRASVWVSASTYESFGIALVESMAAGCVPVVQDISAFREQIEPGKSGMLTDFTQPERAAQDILRALTLSASEREQFVARAREQALQYSWPAKIELLDEIYHKVIRDHAN
jgi:alpha-1,3-mannosyltransferase